MASLVENFEWEELIADGDQYTDLPWLITDAESEVVAKAYAANIPLTLANGLIRKSIALKHLGGQVWEALAHYEKFKPLAVGEERFSFRTGGGTEHITQSLGTTSYAVTGVQIPDYQGAIGVNGDTVQGVDIGARVLEFSITKKFPTGTLNTILPILLYKLTYTVNDAEWRGFQPGEVLFRGASGHDQNEDGDEITYDFAASPNVELEVVLGNESFGGDPFPTVITKGGHEYLWFVYGNSTSHDAHVKVPVLAYVEKVYKEADFSQLELQY